MKTPMMNFIRRSAFALAVGAGLAGQAATDPTAASKPGASAVPENFATLTFFSKGNTVIENDLNGLALGTATVPSDAKMEIVNGAEAAATVNRLALTDTAKVTVPNTLKSGFGAISAAAGVVGADSTDYYAVWATALAAADVSTSGSKPLEIRTADAGAAVLAHNEKLTVDTQYAAYAKSNVTPGADDSVILDATADGLTTYTAKYDLSKATVAFESGFDYTYANADKEPGVTLAHAVGGTVAAGEYTVAYSNNKNAGTATVTVTTAAGAQDYAGEVSGTFTITPKALVAKATAAGKVYHTDDPALDYTVEGLAAGDTKAGVMSGALSRVAGENVGTYAIERNTVAANANYALTYEGADFTITEAALTGVGVTQKDALTFNGEDQTPTVTTAGAAVDGTAVTFTYSLTQGGYGAMPTVKNKDTYTVYYTASAANHTPVTGSFTVTVGAKAVTVAANDAGKTFRAADPELTATVTGLVGGDTLSYTVTRAAGENVGTYAITAAGAAEQGNYTVTYSGATFTIDGGKVKGTFTLDDGVTVKAGEVEVAVDAENNVTVPAGETIKVVTTVTAEVTGDAKVAHDGAVALTGADAAAVYLYAAQADIDAIATLADADKLTLTGGKLKIKAVLEK